MEAVNAYSYGTLAWLGLQAAPLVTWPGFISSMLTPDFQHANDTELYFARQLGFALLFLGLLTVVLTGSLPLTTADESSTPSPSARAVVLLTTLHHAAAASHAYGRHTATGETGFLLGCVGGACLAAFGLWCLLFGGDAGRVSARTGADKRTSGFPFGNSLADKRRGKGKGKGKSE